MKLVLVALIVIVGTIWYARTRPSKPRFGPATHQGSTVDPNLGSKGGLVNGHLRPCPNTPNCVCSQGVEGRSANIDPLPYAENAIARFTDIINANPYARIVVANETYLHAEYRSKWIGFVDDLELLVDREKKVVHVRSASRIGYGDLGVNRQRVEQLRLAATTSQES